MDDEIVIVFFIVLRLVESMNPELIAAIIDFLASLAGLFSSHPHVGTQAQQLTTAIKAAADGVNTTSNELNNPGATSAPVAPIVPAPVAPIVPAPVVVPPESALAPALTPGQIIAGKS